MLNQYWLSIFNSELRQMLSRAIEPMFGRRLVEEPLVIDGIVTPQHSSIWNRQ